PRKKPSPSAVLSVTGRNGGSHESPARNAPRACSAAKRRVAPSGRDRRALRPARGDRRDAAGGGVAQPGARLRGVVDRPSASRATARVPQHRLEGGPLRRRKDAAAAEHGSGPTNAKSCEPEGAQDLTTRLSRISGQPSRA